MSYYLPDPEEVERVQKRFEKDRIRFENDMARESGEKAWLSQPGEVDEYHRWKRRTIRAIWAMDPYAKAYVDTEHFKDFLEHLYIRVQGLPDRAEETYRGIMRYRKHAQEQEDYYNYFGSMCGKRHHNWDPIADDDDDFGYGCYLDYDDDDMCGGMCGSCFGGWDDWW